MPRSGVSGKLQRGVLPAPSVARNYRQIREAGGEEFPRRRLPEWPERIH
ncbi:MAG: hypothetical protein AAEJ47_07890 [Planctomycetota bacterium]